MGTGFPGTGLATIFYLLSVLAMPLVQVARSVRARSWGAAHTWSRLLRHLLLALGMAGALLGTVLVLPDVDLPPSPVRTRAATSLGTAAVLVLLVGLSLYPARALVRRAAQLSGVLALTLVAGLVADRSGRDVGPVPPSHLVAPPAATDRDATVGPDPRAARLVELRERIGMSLDPAERRELAREHAELMCAMGRPQRTAAQSAGSSPPSRHRCIPPRPISRTTAVF